MPIEYTVTHHSSIYLFYSLREFTLKKIMYTPKHTGKREQFSSILKEAYVESLGITTVMLLLLLLLMMMMIMMIMMMMMLIMMMMMMMMMMTMSMSMMMI